MSQQNTFGKLSGQKRPFGPLTRQEMYDLTRPLTTKELLAYLEEDSDIENSEEVEVAYIPPNVDEITDDEDSDDNLIEEGNLDAEIAGTYEIHVPTTIDSEDDDIPLSKIRNKLCGPDEKKPKVLPKWENSTNPDLTMLVI